LALSASRFKGAADRRARRRFRTHRGTGRLARDGASMPIAPDGNRPRRSGVMSHPKNGLTYADAGVDIDAGAAMVEKIKPHVRSTRRPGADGEIGGFGG